MLREVAAASEFDVDGVGNVQEAQDRLGACAATGRPVLVVCDLHLPLLSGLDLLRSLSPATVTAPRRFILLTSNEDPKLEREAYSSGADAFLLRGFAASDLREALEGQIERWLGACEAS